MQSENGCTCKEPCLFASQIYSWTGKRDIEAKDKYKAALNKWIVNKQTFGDV
jgi:hypothetical protein